MGCVIMVLLIWATRIWIVAYQRPRLSRSTDTLGLHPFVVTDFIWYSYAHQIQVRTRIMELPCGTWPWASGKSLSTRAVTQFVALRSLAPCLQQLREEQRTEHALSSYGTLLQVRLWL